MLQIALNEFGKFSTHRKKKKNFPIFFQGAQTTKFRPKLNAS